jgi:hypothetical protein
VGPGSSDSPGDASATYAQWRQGDYIPTGGVFWFVKSVEGDDGPNVKTSGEAVDGMVLLTQTCDLVRPPEERPFVLIAPLVYKPESEAKGTRHGHRPQFAWVPAAGDSAFADLDRVVAYDKVFASKLDWQRGFRTTEEADIFAQTVGRKFSRFAFTDEFHESVEPFLDRVREKHGSLTKPEGEFFAKVRQIRVEADWSAEEIEATLIFILDPNDLPAIPEKDVLEPPEDLVRWYGGGRRPDEIASRLANTDDEGARLYLWNRLADVWVGLCVARYPLTQLTAEVVTSEDMSLQRYWKTQRLDLDYLSGIEDRSGL